MAVLACALIWNNSALADGFRFGDVVVASSNVGSVIGFSFGRVHLLRDGAVVRQMGIGPSSWAWSSAFDNRTNLYVTGPPSPSIYRFDSTAQLAGLFGPFSFRGEHAGLPLAIVFDAEGNAFVTQVEPTKLVKLDPNGAFIREYPMAEAAYSIDLAADQCTLFFMLGRPPKIGKYDVCKDVRLPDLTPLPAISVLGGLRILRDGTLLVADGRRLVRLSESGSVLKNYVVENFTEWTAVAVSLSGRTFWAASGRHVFELSIEEGTILHGPIKIEDFVINSLAVVGEPRAAMTADIPTLGSGALLILAVALLIAALLPLW